MRESSDSFYLKGDHFKAFDLKNDPFYLVRNWNDKLSKPYFCGRAWLVELILALVSLLLLVNSIKNEKSQRENVRLIFRFSLLKDIFFNIILLFYLFFDIQRGYGTTERSEFILTEINGWYNSNDRWKFILFLD